MKKSFAFLWLLLITACCFSQKYDTLYIGLNPIALKRVKPYKTPVGDIPYALFNCRYETPFNPYEYSSVSENNHFAVAQINPITLNEIVVYSGSCSEKRYLYNFIDSVTVRLRDFSDGRFFIKSGADTLRISHAQIKMIYNNEVQVANMQEGDALNSLPGELPIDPLNDLRKPLIFLTTIFYADKQHKEWYLPASFILKFK